MIKLTSEKIKVWKNVREDGTIYFTFSISNKKQDGTYEYMSKTCKFLKDQEPADSCEIMIEDSFLTFKTVDNKKLDYLMIMKYETLEDVRQESFKSDEVVITDDDLPF